jgi:hypothetical protein
MMIWKFPQGSAENGVQEVRTGTLHPVWSLDSWGPEKNAFTTVHLSFSQSSDDILFV